MGAVGLLYVGAVLFLNGLLVLGKVEPRSAAPLNLMVGGLQVLTPTVLIVQSGNDPLVILAASGLYLFGFTYLYVGFGLLAGLDTTGVGYFSLFVAIAALGYSYANFDNLDSAPFGVIWLYWAFLWALFFVLFGLKREGITEFTGYVTTIQGFVTGAIPAYLILTDHWNPDNFTTIAVILAIVGVVMVVGLRVLTHPTLARTEPAASIDVPPAREGAPAPTPTERT